jgi:hypothetical protein
VLPVVVVYLVIIASEGEDELMSARVLFVAACLASAALALLLGTVSTVRARAGLFGGATGLLGAWALLGAFSIGVLILPAAVLAGLATKHVGTGRSEVALGVVAALTVVLAGLVLT